MGMETTGDEREPGGIESLTIIFSPAWIESTAPPPGPSVAHSVEPSPLDVTTWALVPASGGSVNVGAPKYTERADILNIYITTFILI
jgi:hypothetical protein